MNWFGRRAAMVSFLCLSGGMLSSFALAEGLSQEVSRSAVQLDREQQARLHARRVMEAFAKEQDVPFDWSVYEAYEYPYHDFFEEDLKILVLLHGYWGVKERYDDLPNNEKKFDGAILQNMKVSRLKKHLFYKAQGVPYGL